LSTLILPCPGPPRNLHSFPTRRSSDLESMLVDPAANPRRLSEPSPDLFGARAMPATISDASASPAEKPINKRRIRTRHKSRSSKDRKSTRLNSSHLGISYAVFCLKKKK